MNKYMTIGKYLATISIVVIATISLACSCHKRQPINTTNFAKADSICYSILRFDTISQNCFQVSHRDTFWIKDRKTINSIIKALDDHTDFVFAKHGMIVRDIDFCVGDTVIGVCLCQGGSVLRDSLYSSDINFINYMDNITYNLLLQRDSIKRAK